MKRSRTHQGTDGFTLTEMLVVIAILALTTALVLPGTRQSMATQEFNSVSHSLAGLLREARLQAISRNRETSVTLDFNQRIASLDGAQEKTALRRIAIPGTIAIAAVTARGDISTDSATFRFFADGGATGGEIRLSSGKLVRSIAINWLTGNISSGDGSAP